MGADRAERSGVHRDILLWARTVQNDPAFTVNKKGGKSQGMARFSSCEIFGYEVLLQGDFVSGEILLPRDFYLRNCGPT